MRKLLWLSLAALAVIFLLLFIFGASKTDSSDKRQGAEVASQDTHFGIRLWQIADFEGQRVAAVFGYLSGQDDSGQRVDVFCSSAPIGSETIILSHPSLPGTDPLLSKKLEDALLKRGMPSRISDVKGALSSKNSVIIAPTGAVPFDLAQNAGILIDANVRVVVLRSISGKSIGANGSILALSENISDSFETVVLKPGLEDAAVEKAASLAIVPSKARLVQARLYNGGFAAAFPMNWGRAFCRAVYSRGKIMRFSDTSEIQAPNGRLFGPSKIPAGSDGTFEFTLEQPEEEGRTLSFYAVLKNGGKEKARWKVAEGILRGEWGSAFAANASEEGECTIDVVDQFGRVHASAYFESLGFEVKKVSEEGNRFEFYVLFAGKPYSGPISAQIDEGEKKQFSASNGTLVIWAAPRAGEHVMHFEEGGFVGSHPFSSKEGTFFDSYLRLGVPAALFLASVYFLLRAGRKVKYRITFPQAVLQAHNHIPILPYDLEKAWEIHDKKTGGFCLAHHPEEIARNLPNALGEKQMRINVQSVHRALLKLVGEGRFCQSEGMFVPSKRLRGFSASDLRTLRIIHDVLLERGVRFRRKRIFPCGKEVEACVFSSKQGILYNLGKRRRLVVFKDRLEMEEFERSLEAQSPENTKIKLARSLGKLRFAPAERAELENGLS